MQAELARELEAFSGSLTLLAPGPEGDRWVFRQHMTGDATELMFDAGSFDLAWTEHVVMNILDRHALYAGVHHVLRPGGRFAMYDVVAGDEGPPHFPVP